MSAFKQNLIAVVVGYITETNIPISLVLFGYACVGGIFSIIPNSFVFNGLRQKKVVKGLDNGFGQRYNDDVK